MIHRVWPEFNSGDCDSKVVEMEAPEGVFAMFWRFYK